MRHHRCRADISHDVAPSTVCIDLGSCSSQSCPPGTATDARIFRCVVGTSAARLRRPGQHPSWSLM